MASAIRSGRSIRLLRSGVEHIRTGDAAARLIDAGVHLAGVLRAAGYETAEPGPRVRPVP